MKIKELIQKLNKYDENLEIIISIDEKEENRIEIKKCNDKIFITKDYKIIMNELQQKIKKIELENWLNSLSFANQFQLQPLNYNFNETWDEKMKHLGQKMNEYNQQKKAR